MNAMTEKFKIWYLYITVFATGAAILIIEILGTRVISPFYGTTIFVWSSLIIVTLSALALGYWLGGKIADRRPDVRIFYSLVLTAGIATSLIMKIDQPILVFADRFGFQFGPLVATFILFSVPLFLLGALTPFIVRLRMKLPERAGESSGNIFAIATLGSLAGALLAGFVLMPRFSLSAIFFFIAGFLIIIAFAGLLMEKQFAKNPTRILFLLLAFGFFAFPTLRYAEATTNNFEVLYAEPNFNSDLKIVKVGENICIAMDGALQTCKSTGSNGQLFSYFEELKSIVSEKTYGDILILGSGGGAMLTLFAPDQRLDAVEINPKMVVLGEQRLGFKAGPNQSIVIDDARNFLRKTDKKYDLVIMDVSKGFTIPSHLFAKEYFEILASHLNQNGVLAINFFGRTEPEDTLTASVVKTLQTIFPNTAVAAPDIGLQNLLIFASFSDLSPVVSSLATYREAKLNAKDGIVFTDDKNLSETLILPNLETLRNSLKGIGGFKLLFAN
ncbi:MAG: fused MFS/spermidine synthase [bacterium]|nr:fused MFS/spermidine synthase [bacterium]